MTTSTGNVIDASLRFARSDPALLRYARDSAEKVGVPVDDLLRDAIDRVAAIRAAQEPPEVHSPRRPSAAARHLTARHARAHRSMDVPASAARAASYTRRATTTSSNAMPVDL